MARRRKRSAVDRALFHMRPNRVLARYLSGGKHQTFKSIARAPFKERTVHGPKSGKRAYQQLVARDKKQRAQQAAKDRKRAAVDQKAARAQARKQQPRPTRPRQTPIAINARTGRPITIAQAEAAYRAAQREAARIEAELAGTRKPAKPRAPRAAAAPRTPMQVATAEVKAKQARREKAVAKKAAVKRQAARKPGAGSTSKSGQRAPAKQSKTIADTVADLIPARAILAPTAPGRATPGAPTPQPLPVKTRASRNARRGVYGAVLKKTCECAGTGRIPVYDEHGDPNGSISCPMHGRAGKARGRKKWTMRAAVRESGLPGLGARLERKRTSRWGNSDKRQFKAWFTAHSQTRHTGPTLECEWCEGGIVDRRDTERQRAEFIAAAQTEAKAAGRPISKRKLEKLARRAFPHHLCPTCKGLGVSKTSITLTRDGRQPVAEWRAGTKLRRGHRSTGREKTTGKQMTKNAARVERRRKLPRL